MIKTKGAFSIVTIVMIILMLTSTTPVLAESSYIIDSVLVEVNERTIVKVSLAEYSMADFLQDASPIFCYLKGENSYMKIHSIYNNDLDKYISLSEFSMQLFLNNNDLSIAIEKSAALPLETVKTFWEFVEFDENGDPILVPVIPDEEPIDPIATLTITPDSVLGNGFNLSSVKVDIEGVENAEKYAIKYSVEYENKDQAYITTTEAKIGQTNTDLIQYIEGKTDIEVLIYDAKGQLIEIEDLKIEIKN